MEELSLQELKDIEFNLLKQFKAFCDENNIRYYLAYGTLLGAVRYKGFIPWDDDVDVFVPREDYQRVVSLFKDSERYKLFAFEKNNKFGFPFAKLCDMTTVKDEFDIDNGEKLGVDIDIFPLDCWDNNLTNAKKEARRINSLLNWLTMVKAKAPVRVNSFKRFIIRIIIAFFKILGSGFFVNSIIKASNKEKQKGSAYMGCKVWCVYGERGIIPAEAFADSVELEFEGETFPAPAGYDTVLTCLYGDYLPEPPKDKQKTHHSFRAYRISE